MMPLNRRIAAAALALLVTAFAPAGAALGATSPAGPAPVPPADPAAPAASPDPAVRLSGLRAPKGGPISVVAEVSPAPVRPLTADDVTVAAGGDSIAARSTPLVSAATSVAMVVDASAQSAESTTRGGLSGVATFLLQTPPGATLSVVADQSPPELIAPPARSVSSALTAASELGSGGERATPEALSLALDQLRPGAPGVVVLYTAAADAGGEAAPVLARRIQDAGAVLAVVTTSGDDRYWSDVAGRTGGLALSTPPVNSIAAFDRLWDGMQARQVVTFPRPGPTATAVAVRVRTSAGTTSAVLVVPPEPGGPGRPGTAAPPGGGAWWIAAVAVGALLAIMLLTLWSRRQVIRSRSATSVLPSRRPAPDRPPEPPPPADRVRPVGLPGVRVFDVQRSGTPTEITGSLFEPRSVRDAREAMSPSLHERFDEIRQSLHEPAPATGHPDDEPAAPGTTPPQSRAPHRDQPQ